MVSQFSLFGLNDLIPSAVLEGRRTGRSGRIRRTGPPSPDSQGTLSSPHLLQHLADVLAPEDEEDDDDQQQDDGHQAANQNGRVPVVGRIAGGWINGCGGEADLTMRIPFPTKYATKY